jgi:excisionase family DNA binding protein
MCADEAWRMPMETTMNGSLIQKHGLSVHEACVYSGIGKTKLYEAINSGKLKARKAGKRTLILADDLRHYLSSLPLIIKPRAPPGTALELPGLNDVRPTSASNPFPRRSAQTPDLTRRPMRTQPQTIGRKP